MPELFAILASERADILPQGAKLRKKLGKERKKINKAGKEEERNSQNHRRRPRRTYCARFHRPIAIAPSPSTERNREMRRRGSAETQSRQQANEQATSFKT
jgi:hypothetical protein